MTTNLKPLRMGLVCAMAAALGCAPEESAPAAIPAPPVGVSRQVLTTDYAVRIAASSYCSFALKSDGTLLAAGANFSGALGDGTTTSRSTPVTVSGLAGVRAIAGGGGSSTFAVKSDGTAWAWGANESGQLGDGTLTDQSSPVPVSGLAGVVMVSGGGGSGSQHHTVALKANGTVWAWGYNGYGELGDGTTTSRSTPGQVSGLADVVAVAGGAYHSLAVKSDGTVWSWGHNAAGALGDGTTTARSTPVQVSGLSGVTAVAAGYYLSLALKSDGTVWAWGFNDYGSLGDGTTTARSTPVQVSGLAGVTAVAVGGTSLAVKSDGTVWAWGYNGQGGIGDGTTINKSTPVQVSGLSGVTAVQGGSYQSLALKSDGTIWVWGGNDNGQLALGSTSTPHTTPVLSLFP